MKASFYFVLWQLAWLPAILLNIPFLNEYGFFFACIIVFFADRIIRKLLKHQIEYQQMCEVAFIMEMAYNNDYKKYKQQALLQMIVYTVIFVYISFNFIALFTSFSNVPLIDYILWGAFMILAGISSLWHIRLYLQVRKAGCVILDKGLQEIYQSYKDERGTCTYEEMLLPRPKHYKAINTANTIFAILSIVIGLLIITILYTYRGELNSNAELVEISLIIYGALAFYCGIKDLLNTSNSQKYLLLLLSCILVVLLYIPFTSYLNKTFLTAYIGDDSNLSYDAKSNLVQEIIRVDEIASFEPTYRRKRFILALSSESQRKLLENIIRVNAEYRVVYKDSLGKEQAITIAPSELKEIYHQTKSYLDIFLGIIKLDLGENSTKVYDDGEYIIVELWEGENVPYPMQSEQTRISTWLANFAKECAEDYNIASFNRGLKMRLVFNNHRFIENTLSLEEIKKAKENIDLKESKEAFDGLINMLSGKSTENQHK